MRQARWMPLLVIAVGVVLGLVLLVRHLDSGGGTASSAILPTFKTPTPIGEAAALDQLGAKIREAGLKHSAFGCVYWQEFTNGGWTIPEVAARLPVAVPIVSWPAGITPPADFDPRIHWMLYDMWSVAPATFIVIYDETAPGLRADIDLLRYEGEERTCLVPKR